MGFENFDRKTKRLELVNATSLHTKTLWQLASEAGRRVIIINIPLTYPPQPINGLIVSGLFTPSVRSTYTYPESLAEEIRQVAVGYSILKDHELQLGSLLALESLLDTLADSMNQRALVAAYLRSRYDWDLFMVHFQATDILQHRLWPHLDPNHPAHDPEKFHRIGLFYQYLDGLIGPFIHDQSANTFTFVVSDHGFQMHRATINLNDWLHQHGYLRLYQSGIKRLTSYVLPTVRRLDQFGLRNRLFCRSTKESILNFFQQDLMIDWSQTTAFSIGRETYGQIYLTVLPEERVAQMAKLERDLQEMKDPTTGEQIVACCRRGEDIYLVGKHPNNVPDLVVIPKPGYTFSSTLAGCNIFRSISPISRHAGTHHEDGIIVVTGPGVAPSQIPLQADIADIAPTVLFLLGVPIPSYMDGQVLNCVRKSQDIKPQYYHASAEAPYTFAEYSDGEETLIRERLKDLGYLD
jgi:predicted AlkP superfamily phosphohydrolase/phosphomutase